MEGPLGVGAVSAKGAGLFAGNGTGDFQAYGSSEISAGGRYAAFVDTAAGLTANDYGGQNVFVRDLQASSTDLVSVNTNGTSANAGSYYPTISADGSRVAFESYASDLNGIYDGNVATVTLTVSPTQLTPTVSVTDNGGAYTGSPQPVTTALVTGQGHTTLASYNPDIDAGTLSFAYYSVSGNTLTPISGAPTAVGSYAVIATYTSDNPAYTNATSPTDYFSITKATPAASVTDPGGSYTGNPFPATGATVTGVGGDGTLASANPNLDASTLSFAYYQVNASNSLTPLSRAPSAVGNYEVVATCTGDNNNYTNASSSAVPFSITPNWSVVSTTTTRALQGISTGYITPGHLQSPNRPGLHSCQPGNLLQPGSAGDPVIYIPQQILKSLAAGKSLSVSLYFKMTKPSPVAYDPKLFSDPFPDRGAGCASTGRWRRRKPARKGRRHKPRRVAPARGSAARAGYGDRGPWRDGRGGSGGPGQSWVVLRATGLAPTCILCPLASRSIFQTPWPAP